MRIEVLRRFETIGSIGSQWDMLPFERTVWRYDDRVSHVAEVTSVPTPLGYAPGLLVAEVDGQRVDFHDLDVALASIGLTRADIEQQIKAKP